MAEPSRWSPPADPSPLLDKDKEEYLLSSAQTRSMDTTSVSGAALNEPICASIVSGPQLPEVDTNPDVDIDDDRDWGSNKGDSGDSASSGDEDEEASEAQVKDGDPEPTPPHPIPSNSSSAGEDSGEDDESPQPGPHRPCSPKAAKLAKHAIKLLKKNGDIAQVQAALRARVAKQRGITNDEINRQANAAADRARHLLKPIKGGVRRASSRTSFPKSPVPEQGLGGSPQTASLTASSSRQTEVQSYPSKITDLSNIGALEEFGKEDPSVPGAKGKQRILGPYIGTVNSKKSVEFRDPGIHIPGPEADPTISEISRAFQQMTSPLVIQEPGPSRQPALTFASEAGPSSSRPALNPMDTETTLFGRDELSQLNLTVMEGVKVKQLNTLLDAETREHMVSEAEISAWMEHVSPRTPAVELTAPSDVEQPELGGEKKLNPAGRTEEQAAAIREGKKPAKATNQPVKEEGDEAAAKVTKQRAPTVTKQPADGREGEEAAEASGQAEENGTEDQRSRWDKLTDKFRRKEYIRDEELEYGVAPTWELGFKPGRMRPE